MLAVTDASAEAMKRSCGQFLSGLVPDRNNGFLPTAAELSANARAWDAAIAQVTADRELARLGTKDDNGLLEMDFGHGMVNLRGLTTEEQDAIIKNNGMINGKNAALMDLETKRAALRALPAPNEGFPIPQLRTMK